MGLREILTGRRRLAAPAPDRLFAMSTAWVTMESELGMTSRGRAAIVFQSLATADFSGIERDMRELVQATASEGGTTVETSVDAYGFSWMVLADEDFDDLVVGLNAVTSALTDGGYGDRVLCAVFGFTETGRPPTHPLYLVYNVKRGTFSPFAPTGENVRDNERELQLRAQLGTELPIEPELSRWFALWGIPI